MIRVLLWLLGGLLLGGAIHIVVILTLPVLSERSVWTRVAHLPADNRMVTLPSAKPGAPNPLGLDPLMAYGLCRVDLGQEPAYVMGTMPYGFWSLAVFDANGVITHAITHRDTTGQALKIGIFNAIQMQQLARPQRNMAEDVLVVEAPSDEVLVLVRISPPHQAMRERFENALAALRCGPRSSVTSALQESS